MPRTRFCIKEPLQPASLPPSEPALHPPQTSQTHGPPPPVGSRPRGAAPSDETRPRAPLRPIRSKPLCTRAAAQPDPARPGGRFVRSVALDVAARAAAENPHVCVICPVAVIHSLAISIRWGNPPIVKSTCWDNPPIAKTKISASLQLFCDCELFPVPAKRKRSLHTANYLHFCASIRNWEARNNCQSQKSCNLSRFFVSGLLE